MPTVQQVLNHLTQLAPLRLAEPWDNVGLLIGDPAAEVSSIVVSLDATSEVCDFASSKSADLLVTHHPLFLKPPPRFVEDEPVGRLALRCARLHLNLIAMHTNLDNAEGGVGDALAAKLGLANVRVLSPTHCDPYCKVAVFVPADHLDKVREAMALAGAGVIGEYAFCSFQTPGTGTFLPSGKASPFIGSAGSLETVEELRLEMLVRKSLLPNVLAGMIAAHPYEEVAYDVYPLDNPGRELGCLKAGDLEPPMLGDQFLQHVLQSLASDTARTIGEMPGVVTHVAVCPGSGASFLDAVAHSGAEVYVTGDLKHHDALRAKELGLAVVDVGHAVSEEVAVELLERKLRTLTADLAESGETATLHRVRQSCQSYPWHDVKVEVFGTWDTRSRRPER